VAKKNFLIMPLWAVACLSGLFCHLDQGQMFLPAFLSGRRSLSKGAAIKLAKHFKLNQN
jgi:hypothetical protein